MMQNAKYLQKDAEGRLRTPQVRASAGSRPPPSSPLLAAAPHHRSCPLPAPLPCCRRTTCPAHSSGTDNHRAPSTHPSLSRQLVCNLLIVFMPTNRLCSSVHARGSTPQPALPLLSGL